MPCRNSPMAIWTMVRTLAKNIVSPFGLEISGSAIVKVDLVALPVSLFLLLGITRIQGT